MVSSQKSCRTSRTQGFVLVIISMIAFPVFSKGINKFGCEDLVHISCSICFNTFLPVLPRSTPVSKII